MKLGIVYGEISTQHQLIMERAEDIFDTVLAAPVDGLKFVHGPDGTKVMYKETDLTTFDAVYVRTDDRDMLFAEHLVEVLNDAGVVTQAENDTYAYESNKFYSMKVLAENGVTVPNSIYTLSPDAAIKGAEKLGYPVILKTVRGVGGEGVMRVSSENELKPIMDAMTALDQDIVLQEYIEHAGQDTRVIVIDDRVYAYSRRSAGDEWRSNISAGGERLPAEMTDELEDLGLTAARVVGFDMCGSDVVNTPNGLYLLEINGAFGISEEMNEIIGEDIVLHMVERLHDLALKQQH